MKKVYWHFGIALLSVSLVLAACDTVGGVSPYFQAVRDAADLLAELEALGESAGGVDVTRDGTTVTLEATTGTPTVTLTDDLPIQAGVTLAVGANVTLEVPAGKALTVEGTLDVEGALTVNGGAVTNNGVIHHKSGDSATALNTLIVNIGHGTGEADIPLTAEFYGSVSTASTTGGIIIPADAETALAHVTITGNGASELAAGLTVKRANVTLDNVDFTITENTKTPTYSTGSTGKSTWKTGVFIDASNVILKDSTIVYTASATASTNNAVTVSPPTRAKNEGENDVAYEGEVSTAAAQLTGIEIINNTISVTAKGASSAAALRIHGAAGVKVINNTLTAQREANFSETAPNGDITTAATTDPAFVNTPANALYVYNVPSDFTLDSDNFTGNTLNGYNFDFYLHSPLDATTAEADIGNFSTASTTFFKGDTTSGQPIGLQKLLKRLVENSTFTNTNGGFGVIYLRRSTTNDYDREQYLIDKDTNLITRVSYWGGTSNPGDEWGSYAIDASGEKSATKDGFYISRTVPRAPYNNNGSKDNPKTK